MTDASKRLFSEEAVDERRQFPIPKGMSKSAHRPEPKFPPGVGSLKTWGKVIVETVKYAKQDLTYEELIASTQKEKQLYCHWMVAGSSAG